MSKYVQLCILTLFTFHLVDAQHTMIKTNETALTGLRVEAGSGRGIHGISQDSVAVIGESETNVGTAGVSNFSAGVQGQSTLDIGVVGISELFIGVFGESETSFGIVGNSPVIGIQGQSMPGIGIVGLSDTNIGIVGVSNNTNSWDFDAQGMGMNYGSTSSRRWKTNIINIDKPLEKLSKLRGVYFDWDVAHGGQHDVGFIAEEVGEILPEIVGYEENGVDATGLDYSKMTPLLVEASNAMRSEYKQIFERQEEKIQELSSELKAMKLMLKKIMEDASLNNKVIHD